MLPAWSIALAWKNKCISITYGSQCLVTMAWYIAIMFLLMNTGDHKLTQLFREQRDRETERQSPFYAPQDSVLLTVHGLVFNSPPPSRAVPSWCSPSFLSRITSDSLCLECRIPQISVWLAPSAHSHFCLNATSPWKPFLVTISLQTTLS